MSDDIPSILMVSWNRSEYYRRTMAHLLADPSDFRLHLWDNGSQDGLADFITELRDDRIVERQLNRDNVGQFKPWHWFVDACTTTIGGKLDDDILGEAGWMTRYAGLLGSTPALGLLGAWVFQREEWDEALAAHKMRQIGDVRIFQNTWVAGCIFLGRIETLRRFTIHDPATMGVPVDHKAITRSGLVSGYPLPISFAHNLDDPRSPHCRMNRPGGWDQFAALTARLHNFKGPDDYAEWIAQDAHDMLVTPIKDQLKLYDAPSMFARVKARLRRLSGLLTA